MELSGGSLDLWAQQIFTSTFPPSLPLGSKTNLAVVLVHVRQLMKRRCTLPNPGRYYIITLAHCLCHTT